MKQISKEKGTLSRLASYLSGYRAAMIFACVSAVVSVVAGLCGPILIGRAVDCMLGKGSVDFGRLGGILVGLGVVYAINVVFQWTLTFITSKVSYQAAQGLRRDGFAKLRRFPLRYFDTHARGDVISRFVNDCDTISDGLIQSLSVLLTGVVTVAGALGFMLYINVWITLIVVATTPLSIWVAKFISSHSRRMFREQSAIVGELSGIVEEMVGGQKTVKAFCYEGTANARFRETNARLKTVGVKAQFYSSLTNPTTRYINNLIYILLGVVGGLFAIQARISVGDLSSFLIYSTQFAKPVNEITGVITQLQASLASARRIFELLDGEEETPDVLGRPLPSDVQGHIVFDNVSFAYQPSRPLIRHLSLDIPAGSKVAIVGTTGAGKTTLVNLLMRFYDVDEGRILLDGTDIRDFPRDWLRQNFGMVLQDTWLFHGTIAENIAYGKPDATREDIIVAAKAAHAHSFIRRLEKGYDTVITQDGENLSQGQKQLLTIARIMLVDPPMVILDEATSNIDTLTEIKVQQAFLQMTQGRTSFVIAHRLSTIREADRILLMENGDVVESGTHEELLERKGKYHALYHSQFARAEGDGQTA